MLSNQYLAGSLQRLMSLLVKRSLGLGPNRRRCFYSTRFVKRLSLYLLLNTMSIGLSAQPHTLGAIVVEGSTAFSKQQLLRQYFDLVGLKPGDDTKEKLQTRIIDYYQAHNYYLPAIAIELHPDFDNVLLVQIQEPRIGSFVVTGGNTRLQEQAQETLHTLSGLNLYSPEQLQRLENVLAQRLNAEVNIEAQQNSGDKLALDLAVSLQPDLYANITLSNEGSDRLGKEILSANAGIGEPLSWIHEWYVQTFNSISTDAFRSVGSGLVFQLGDDHELLLDTNISRAKLEPDDGSPDIVFDRRNLTLGWRFNREQSLSGGFGFNALLLTRDFQQEQVELDIDEKLRLAELGYWQYRFLSNSFHRWQVAATKGLDNGGAKLSGPLADPNTDIDFTKLNLSWSGQFQLPEPWSLQIDTVAQFSSDNLPFSQRFTIASNVTARAFESGELNGDSGAGVKFEVRRNFETAFIADTWVPYAYYGIGRVTDNLQNESTTGASVGVGIRWFARRFSGYLEVGKPLIEKSVYRTSTPRAQLGFTVHF